MLELKSPESLGICLVPESPALHVGPVIIISSETHFVEGLPLSSGISDPLHGAFGLCPGLGWAGVLG